MLESTIDIEVAAEAENGRAAVDEAIRHRADVAPIDVRMPLLDGLGAIEELRRRGRPRLAEARGCAVLVDSTIMLAHSDEERHSADLQACLSPPCR